MLGARGGGGGGGFEAGRLASGKLCPHWRLGTGFVFCKDYSCCLSSGNSTEFVFSRHPLSSGGFMDKML